MKQNFKAEPTNDKVPNQMRTDTPTCNEVMNAVSNMVKTVESAAAATENAAAAGKSHTDMTAATAGKNHIDTNAAAHIDTREQRDLPSVHAAGTPMPAHPVYKSSCMNESPLKSKSLQA